MRSNLKIAHIITKFAIGGATENTLFTTDYLVKKNYNVTLVTGKINSEEAELYKNFKTGKMVQCPFLERELSLFNDIKAFIFLYKYFKKEKFDIIHTHSSKAGIIGRLAAFASNIPVIIHTVHGLPFHNYEKKWKNLIYVFSEKLCAFFTTKIITVCETMKIKSVKAKIAKEKKFITIRSGMELSPFLNIIDSQKVLQMKSEFNISPNEFIFIKIARLFPLKGHWYLLKAFKNVIQKYADAKLILVGDGVLRPEIERFLQKNNMDKNVILAGFLRPEKIPELLEISDCVVHTSLREGLARAIPQGFLKKKPVISFDVDGAWELVQNNRTGYLIEAENVEELADKMIEVIENREKSVEMAVTGFQKVVKLYDVKNMCQEIERLYRNAYETRMKRVRSATETRKKRE